ncbi:MFS transporter [Bacteroides sp. GM023]|uniref:MFS transporter n=1 Tax=Bacteroides sp. GM023 TaxID=2723058 RepID=UPI00168B968F|nr:MFS transporter [Bacteroides sp. GM023]MBD3589696.1 MFS transporter [Bacteroides sp. GM023]
MNNQFTHPKERIRFAILTFFFAQGLCMASWASRIPDFKDIFAANYAFYWGLILFMIPVGKFVAIPLAGYLVSKLGSRSMVQVSIIGYASALLCVGLAHEVYLLGFLLFCFGVFWNLCDISFNTQGIEVERLYGKTIMATFHGGWSLGACAGALIGFVMILTGVSPVWHYALIFLIILIIALSGRKYLQDSMSQEVEVPGTDKTGTDKEEATRKAPNGFRLLFQKPEMLLLQLGLVGLFALIVESAMFDWSAVYFESVVHVPKSLQIGFLVFMVMMATGRFLTNYAYQLWGKKRVLQLAGSFICIGFFVSALLGGVFESMAMKVIINSLGFMLVGLGISCIVPTLYSFVGAKSKTPVSIALTILSSISFIGSLIAPLLIGAISQAFDIRVAYMIIGILGGCIVFIVSFTKAFEIKQ